MEDQVTVPNTQPLASNNSSNNDAEVNKKVMTAGIGMLAMLLFVVGAWVFFVMYNREKAAEIIARSPVMQKRNEDTQVMVLETELNELEIELSALDVELENEPELEFDF